jgi:hypothetical protein
MNIMEIDQVVLWGHKLRSHKHSDIHYGFFKAFEYLGYKTLWLDNETDIGSIDFYRSLFITEGEVDKKIPIVDNCYYILHNCNMDKYKRHDIRIRILILEVYTKECIIRNLKKLENYIYYEPKSEENEYAKVYMPWATDLLPYEIDKNMKNIDKNVLEKKTNIINFVGMGMITDDLIIIKLFCTFNNLLLNAIDDFSSNNNETKEEELIQNSYIAPVIQTDYQIEKGYIPSIIFKNISYGKMGITNNITIAELFNGNIIYNQDILKTLELGIEFENNENKYKKYKLLYLMEYVKMKHTYINRIRVLLNCLNMKN